MAGRYNEEYVYGSEAPARKAAPVRKEAPVRVPRRQEHEESRSERYARENIRKASRFGGVYTLFITAAVSVMLFVCVNYISVINTRTDNSKEIIKLQEQLNDLKEANDQTQLSIDTSIDYDYIYRVATDELGMVYADQEHVVNYKSGESQYVIQYSNVPEK